MAARAALIKNEKTLCIKKMHLHHSCPTEPSSNRINSSFLSTTYVDKFKADINTDISYIQEKAKKEFGVDVPRGWPIGQGPKLSSWC
jgi:hypothetical protein